MEEEKQACGYCPEHTCLLDCEICNPKKGIGVTVIDRDD